MEEDGEGNLNACAVRNCNISVRSDEGSRIAEGAVGRAGDRGHKVDVAAEHDFAC